LAQIGRLRYELFIERDGKPYRGADKEQRLFLEPVDKCSLNFFGTIGNDCVIAVRSTKVEDAKCDERLSRVVEKSALATDRIATTVVYSRFVVRERIRARLLIPATFRLAYQTALSSGMSHAILAARPSLIPIFERFGFVAEATAFLDEIAGPMVIMTLDLLDRTRLAEMDALPDYDKFACRSTS
jgi:predicted GNAT family N-acyltransferase